MKILTLVRLAPIKIYDHLLPMVLNPQLEHLTIARYASVPLEHPKITQLAYGDASDGGSDGLPPLRRAWHQMRLFGLAWRAARRHQPNVIYGIFFTTNGVMAWALGRLLGKKVLVSLIGTDLNKHILEYPIGKLLLPILRRVDCLTVFDEAARQKLIGRGVAAGKIFVLPHAIQMHNFVYNPQAPKDIDAIFTGMFVPLKEVQRLVAAWRLVVDARPGARLALVGDGLLRAELEAQARALGLGDNIHFTGWVQDVGAYLQRSRIFVNLSNQEGVPHAMIEAMACGLVPLVTAVGGVPSVIQDGENGFLVANPADPAQVAQRLLTLLDDPARYAQMQAAALAVRQTHTYQAIADAWTPILAFLARAV